MRPSCLRIRHDESHQLQVTREMRSEAKLLMEGQSRCFGCDSVHVDFFDRPVPGESHLVWEGIMVGLAARQNRGPIGRSAPEPAHWQGPGEVPLLLPREPRGNLLRPLVPQPD